ncbi:MAG: hypothetical protein ABEH61_00375 [Haloarculaceae archaeon]
MAGESALGELAIGVLVAGVSAALAFSVLSGAGIGSTPLRAAFAMLVGVAAAQAFERL